MERAGKILTYLQKIYIRTLGVTMNIIIDTKMKIFNFNNVKENQTIEIGRTDDTEPFLVITLDDSETLRLKIKATSKMRTEGRILGLPYID